MLSKTVIILKRRLQSYTCTQIQMSPRVAPSVQPIQRRACRPFLFLPHHVCARFTCQHSLVPSSPSAPIRAPMGLPRSRLLSLCLSVFMPQSLTRALLRPCLSAWTAATTVSSNHRNLVLCRNDRNCRKQRRVRRQHARYTTVQMQRRPIEASFCRARLAMLIVGDNNCLKSIKSVLVDLASISNFEYSTFFFFFKFVILNSFS